MKTVEPHQHTSRNRHALSRRSFLETVGASAAGLVLQPFLTSADLLAYGKAGRNSANIPVALTQVDSYDRALIKQKVQYLFETLGGVGDIFHAGNKVAVKINLTGGSGSASSPKLGGRPITESMWTHPEVLRAVGELILDCGVSPDSLTIVEALWDSASFADFGYQEVQTSLGAHLVDLNKVNPYSSFVTRNVGPNTFFYNSFTVNQILTDIDVYVSIPKLKEHYEAGVTASLKNQIGMVPKQLYTLPSDSGRRGALHNEGTTSPTHLPRSICDLNLARPVHLSVIDGVRNARGGEGVWNPTFVTAEDHVLIAGKEPVATDSIAAYLLGHNPEAPTIALPDGGACDNYLDLLHQKGIGTNQMSDIIPVGDGARLVSVDVPRHRRATPEEFELFQNFPNPFNPSTTFSFYLPEDAVVSIRIFDITGRLIQTLVDGRVPRGIHEVRWSPHGISGGTYFCEMRAAGRIDTRKMIYQR